MAARPTPFRFSAALFERLGRRFANRSRTVLLEGEAEEETHSPDQAARQALTVMLEDAVQVLKDLGLPCRPGFYRWDPGAMEWSFLSGALTPAERWAMVLEAPPGDGWRYATLPQVVRQEMPDHEAVRHAADVLEQGQACLNAADQNGAGGFEPAIKLAVAWANFQVARIVPNSDRREPLKLYFPPDESEPLATPRIANKAAAGPQPQPGTPKKPGASKARVTRRARKPGASA
jgi:hypothetical protein